MHLFLILSSATLALVVASESIDNDVGTMSLRLVDDSVAKKVDAKCLDGSLPGFYYRTDGSESIGKRAIIFLEGGGWCGASIGKDDDFESCAKRADTDSGSSSNYSSTTADYGGILSRNCAINPAFCQDDHYFVKYCDGSSFTGKREGSVSVDGKDLYFRGRANLDAVLTMLVEKFDLLQKAEIILSGGSAGGVATYMALDHVNEVVRKQTGSMVERVVGFPDTGLFLDDRSFEDVGWWKHWQQALELWGSHSSLNQKCLARFSAVDHFNCLLVQNMLPFIETPFYAMNSAVDMWYSQYVAGIGCIGWPPVREKICTKEEVVKMQKLISTWKQMFLPMIEQRGHNGYFVDNCIVHEQNVDYCSYQKVANCVGWDVYEAFDAAGKSLGKPRGGFYEFYFRTTDRWVQYVEDESTFPKGNPTCDSLQNDTYKMPGTIEMAEINYA